MGEKQKSTLKVEYGYNLFIYLKKTKMKYIIFFLALLINFNLLSQRTYQNISKIEGIKSLTEFKEFLSIPNDGKDKQEIYRNIDWAKSRLSKLGFDNKLLETSFLPLLVSEKIVNPELPTIGFYMHLDGQSVDLSKWDQESPWIPVLKKKIDGNWEEVEWSLTPSKLDNELRIFARSSSDDKGPFLMFLTALRILDKINQKPKFNLKVILDFEEETSSPGLPEAVDKYQQELMADMLLILDGPGHFSGKPTLVFGNRGISSITLTTFGPITPQHSGHYGNYIPNPALRLTKVLSSMKSDDGKVLIPGFYDGIFLDNKTKKILNRIPSEDQAIKYRTKINSVDKVGENYQESIQYPSLNIRGLKSGWVGDQTRTIIPSEATAEIDIRLVLESDPKKLINSVKEHIKLQGYTVLDYPPSDEQRLKYEKIIQMNYKISYSAFRTPVDSKEGKWLEKILKKTYNEIPVLIRTQGGSVPISPFVNKLGIPAVGVPTVNLDNNQHSPNENLRLGNYFQGIETFISILIESYK